MPKATQLTRTRHEDHGDIQKVKLTKWIGPVKDICREILGES